jgi:hypothetical protein
MCSQTCWVIDDIDLNLWLLQFRQFKGLCLMKRPSNPQLAWAATFLYLTWSVSLSSDNEYPAGGQVTPDPRQPVGLCVTVTPKSPLCDFSNQLILQGCTQIFSLCFPLCSSPSQSHRGNEHSESWNWAYQGTVGVLRRGLGRDPWTQSLVKLQLRFFSDSSPWPLLLSDPPPGPHIASQGCASLHWVSGYGLQHPWGASPLWLTQPS